MLNTKGVVNLLSNLGFNKFRPNFLILNPSFGEIDILAQKGKVLCCFEIKESKRNRFNYIIEGISQLKKDRNYILLDRSGLVEEREDLSEFSQVKLFLITIFAGKVAVYCFGNNIGNGSTNVILQNVKAKVDFSEFTTNF